MRLGLLLALAMLSAGLTGAAAVAEPALSWQPLKPEGEPFTIEMPGTAKEETMDMMDDPKAPLISKTYTVQTAAGAAYIMNCTVLPPAQAQKVKDDAQGMLTRVRDGSLKGMGATMTSDKEISISGYPAREVAGKAPGGLITQSRMAIVGDRLCQALAVMPPAEATANVRRFLDSLSFQQAK